MVFEHGPGDEGGFGGFDAQRHPHRCARAEQLHDRRAGGAERRRQHGDAPPLPPAPVHDPAVPSHGCRGVVVLRAADKTTTISLAFPVSDALAPQRSASGELVFAYLPVTAVGLGFALHADFELVASRQDVSDGHSGNHVLLARVPKLVVHAVRSDPVLGEEAFAAYLPDSEAVRQENRSGGGRKWHTLALALHHETKSWMMVPTEDAPEKVRRKNAVLRPAHLSPALVPNSLLKTVTAGEMHCAHAVAVVDMCLQHCLEACPVSTVLDCIRVALDRAARGGASAGDDVPSCRPRRRRPAPPTATARRCACGCPRGRLPSTGRSRRRRRSTPCSARSPRERTKLLAAKYRYIEPGPQ